MQILNISDFKIRIKTIFPNERVWFTQKINGTVFGGDGKIFIANIKKSWDYEIPPILYDSLIESGFTTGSVNDIIKIRYAID